MNKKRNKRPRSRKSALADESQAVIAITVFWMLCGLATACAEIMWIVAQMAMLFGTEPFLEMLKKLAVLIGAVTGVCALLATPLVLKARHGRVPRSLFWGIMLLAAVALGLAIVS